MEAMVHLCTEQMQAANDEGAGSDHATVKMLFAAIVLHLVGNDTVTRRVISKEVHSMSFFHWKYFSDFSSLLFKGAWLLIVRLSKRCAGCILVCVSVCMFSMKGARSFTGRPWCHIQPPAWAGAMDGESFGAG